MCWFTRFVVNCRETHSRAFCREIHQSAKIGGRGGVKPILAMPGFSRLLLQPPLPKSKSQLPTSHAVAWNLMAEEKVSLTIREKMGLRCAPQVFSEFSMSALVLFSECALCDCVCSRCVLSVLWVCSDCSPSVLWVCSECSLSVQSDQDEIKRPEGPPTRSQARRAPWFLVFVVNIIEIRL